MAVDISAVVSQPGAATNAGRARLADSYETFLALLTTQLKNQDPTAPLDTNQFTQQLVQMTGVEQQLLTNDLLRSLADKGGDGLTGAVGYIGKTVRAEGATATLAGGAASWGYEMPRDAASVTLEVLDSAGRVVRREAGAAKAGQQTFAWDGKDQGGTRLPDGGAYTLRVTAKDALGAAVKPTLSVEGVVRAVEQADGEVRLMLNGVAVPLSAVLSVRQTS